MKKALFALGLVCASCAQAAGQYYWKGDASSDPTATNLYLTSAYSMTGDPVTNFEGIVVNMSADAQEVYFTDASMPVLAQMKAFRPRTNGKIYIDIDQDWTIPLQVNLWANAYVIKRGKGNLILTSDSAIDSQNRHTDHNQNWIIEGGRVTFPQSVSGGQYYFYASLAISNNCSVVLPGSTNVVTTTNGNFAYPYVSRFFGEGDILFTNAVSECRLFQSIYEENPRPFSGHIIDPFNKLEFRVKGTYLTATNNQHQSNYLYGLLGARILGSEAKTCSSLGYGTLRSTLSCQNAIVRCLATEADGPQTSSRRWWDYGNSGTFTFDAGAYGGLTLYDGHINVRFGDYMKEFILTGSNTVESVFSMPVCHVNKEATCLGHYYLTKRGSGTWRMSTRRDYERTRFAGVGVEEGTLKFDSLAERGETCSLGTATNLYGYAYNGAQSAAPAEVDYAIRLGTATNSTRVGTLSYSGESDVAVTSRVIAVCGTGRLRNETAKNLSLVGLKGILPPEGGDAPAANTLYLDAASTASTNTLTDITEEPLSPALSLVKEGAGAWTLAGRLAFTGALDVECGALTLAADPTSPLLPTGPSSLSVAAGASLTVTNDALVVTRLVLDAATGIGGLTNISFATTGELVLENTENAHDVTWPVVGSGLSGLENLTNWTVRLPADDPWAYKVMTSDGALRIVRQSIVLTGANANVVVAWPRKTGTEFAARELTNAIYQAFGAAPAITYEPVAGKINFILGDNAYAKAVGLESAKLPYDGFVIRVDAETQRVYILGEDTGYSPFYRDPKTYSASTRYPHATSFGVYEFLERFAGCRFFFAGRLGTIYPKQTSLEIPAGDIADAPTHTVRSYYYASAALPEGSDVTSRENSNLNWARHRLETQNVPCSHGTIRFKYLERFGESHPEYFALRSTSSTNRHNYYDGSSHSLNGHLCWSSAITNEIYLDAKAYLTGGSAADRGITGGWGKNCQQNKYVDIMANDGYPGCYCATCLANRVPGTYFETFTMWNATRTIAQHLLDDGVAGYITQMAYGYYNQIPDFDLPTNVLVMVAKRGPWSIYDTTSYEKQKQDIRDWAAKIGADHVWMWNYENKYSTLNIANIPQMCPKAWGAFYTEMAPYVFGSFAEAETDRWYFNHLNYYVYAKLAWKSTLDVDEILDDYYSKMYGAAAEDVKEFFEILEDIWLKEVACRMEETADGPMSCPPNEYQVWTQIYTAERLAAWGAILDRAAAKLDSDSLEAERLALCRQELLGIMETSRTTYLESIDVQRELNRRARHPNEVKRDIIDNGDFVGSPLHNGRFMPNGPINRNTGRDSSWYTDTFFTPFPLTNSTFVTGTQCAVLTGRVDNSSQICQYLPLLKSNHTYRVSMFLKGENLESANHTGGAGVTLMDRYNNSYPTTARFDGTFDWIHFSFIHTANPETRGEGAPMPYMRIGISQGCLGRLYIDGVQFVDLEEKDGFEFFVE